MFRIAPLLFLLLTLCSCGGDGSPGTVKATHDGKDASEIAQELGLPGHTDEYDVWFGATETEIEYPDLLPVTYFVENKSGTVLDIRIDDVWLCTVKPGSNANGSIEVGPTFTEHGAVPPAPVPVSDTIRVDVVVEGEVVETYGYEFEYTYTPGWAQEAGA